MFGDFTVEDWKVDTDANTLSNRLFSKPKASHKKKQKLQKSVGSTTSEGQQRVTNTEQQQISSEKKRKHDKTPTKEPPVKIAKSTDGVAKTENSVIKKQQHTANAVINLSSRQSNQQIINDSGDKKKQKKKKNPNKRNKYAHLGRKSDTLKQQDLSCESKTSEASSVQTNENDTKSENSDLKIQNKSENNKKEYTELKKKKVKNMKQTAQINNNLEKTNNTVLDTETKASGKLSKPQNQNQGKHLKAKMACKTEASMSVPKSSKKRKHEDKVEISKMKSSQMASNIPLTKSEESDNLGNSKSEQEATKLTLSKSQKKKEAKRRRKEQLNAQTTNSSAPSRTSSLDLLKLGKIFENEESNSAVDNSVPEEVNKNSAKTLLERMSDKLNAARFRYLNEKLYNQTGKESKSMFKDDTEAFNVYHRGFSTQVSKWPVNPVDTMIKMIKSLPRNQIVADFGCGDAKLAANVEHKVHSFDLVAVNKHVTVCDISKVPLKDGCIDVAVFCLSLMGTNMVEFLKEAHRVLKPGGTLKIAEVTSRFTSLPKFMKAMEQIGFKVHTRETENKMFWMFDFKKKGKPSTGPIKLHLDACVYKKR